VLIETIVRNTMWQNCVNWQNLIGCQLACKK